MKLHFLRYFVVVAEELHFGRAAERLSITQPPLSIAIKSLEEELGVQLLVRSKNHVELTAPGEAVLREAREILGRVEYVSHVAKAAARGVRGRLRIGTTGSLVYRGVAEIVHDFASAVPRVEVVLHEMTTGEQVHELLHGRLDAGFLSSAFVPPRLQAIKLADDEYVVCLPETHARATARSLKLHDLHEERFVSFTSDIEHANYDNLIAIFSSAGIRPQTVHTIRQSLTAVAMVAKGLGICLVPRSLVSARTAGVRFVRLAGPPAVAPAVLAWNPAQASPALLRFLDSARKTLRARPQPARRRKRAAP